MEQTVRARHAVGCSQRAIARELKIDRRKIKRITILLAAAAAAAAVTVAVPASASAAAPAGASPVVGHVYVNDNTAGTNTIAVFDRHADGALTPHAG